MDQIALGTSGRHTTRLGFGCSSLIGATTRRESLRLLETAFDAGIRHFDVAPMYGYGEAESCLGEFLQRHPGQLTVTTKYGIAPPKNSAVLKLGRRIANPLLKRIPSLKKTLAHAANAATRNDLRPAFTAAEARASLHRSLAALRTDRIDLWLLHEATASDLADDALLSVLESEVEAGTVGSFGTGSGVQNIPALLAERPAYCHTLQYEWSVLDTPIDPQTLQAIQLAKPFRIHHRALTDNFRTLHTALINNKSVAQRWSEATSTDLRQSEALARLMLKAALVLNPDSIILVSSKSPKHIQSNVRTAIDAALDQPARTLYALVTQEHSQLLPKPLP
jgi:aryl-alcohol dehydrogenase-like predicted oxidoreductase